MALFFSQRLTSLYLENTPFFTSWVPSHFEFLNQLFEDLSILSNNHPCGLNLLSNKALFIKKMWRWHDPSIFKEEKARPWWIAPTTRSSTTTRGSLIFLEYKHNHRHTRNTTILVVSYWGHICKPIRDPITLPSTTYLRRVGSLHRYIQHKGNTSHTHKC
jgi:hypothetical protein